MNYRKATNKDLGNLAVLFDGYRVFYKKESDVGSARNFISERLSNEDSVIFVAEDAHGSLLGFTQLYPLFSSTRMKALWLLNDLYVSPDARGKGVSIGLITRAKELVVESKACGMFLETGKSNIVGNNLYPKTGFKLNDSANFYEWTAE